MHIALHFFLPFIICFVFFRKNWPKAYLIMMATLLIDLDHLLANPIYDDTRCSIGFHPLHTFVPIGFYIIACFIPKIRLIGIGLMIHIVLDSIDCQMTNGLWFT